MKERVVKCVYNFTAETETDLGISIGELIRITNVINDDWFEGELHGKTGQFPSAYVEECDDVFELVLATNTFAGEQDGDLSFKEGDFIVVTEILDENWMKGYIQGGAHGMFPRAYVKNISSNGEVTDTVTSSETDNQINESELNGEDEIIEDVSEENKSEDKWVDVLENFSAMDSTELDLVAGTKVKIIGEVDDFWCQGISESGKEGIFPRNFVDLPPCENVESKESSEVSSSEPLSDKTESISSPEPTVDQIENVPSVKSSEKNETENISSSEPWTNVSDDKKVGELKPIGELKALYDFHSEVDGDLKFDSGQKIFLLEQISNNWMKGQIDNIVGIFPINYVDVVEMYPAEEPKPLSPQHSISSNESETVESPNLSPKPLPKPKPKPSIKPSKPPKPSAKPVKPEKPVKPAKPAPEEPEISSKPERPGRPEESEKPGRPIRPSKPDSFDEPEKPGRPERPNRPEQEPEKTDKPERPGKPERPTGKPEKPTGSRPDRPSKPDKLEDDNSNITDRPGRPGKPNLPDEPQKVNKPSRPEQPEKLDKPNRPQRPKLPPPKRIPDDEYDPFSFDFDTKSKPIILIPKKYFQPGSTQVLLLKNWIGNEFPKKEIKMT